ncbi:glycosyltransferase family 2 protein [Shimia sp. R11_0]|uniref:glycosyltransferase family 2 protein n=1 Tax=Shimia sp. R11_0 TaxID=2821096 RepID=UPI001ADAFE60|nr:glycosyltransferase family 2 protein [Shimia sp. R11_0]MBO9479503.1 glycosyltransferase family 2 protein [Shimia sp. R11_0]
MHPILQKYADFKVVSNDLSHVNGFTLTGLVHNEMYFLPPFLAHYRALGVKRFIFVDDRSTDGTTEYLAAQSDVMVVKSSYKYGDKIPPEEAAALSLPHQRVELLWRMALLEQYNTGTWSLHLDADEFLDLPGNMQLSELAGLLNPNKGRAIWSAMLDMYPATVSDLQKMALDETLDQTKPWFFDGQPHMRLRQAKPPKLRHPGSRARLLDQHGLNAKSKGSSGKIRRLLQLPPKRYNNIRKPILFHWSIGDRFYNAHEVSLPTSKDVLLPLRHYKFNGSVAERIIRAQTTGGNTNGGREYNDLGKLLEAMRTGNPSFLYRKSVRFTGYQDFERTGNTFGISRQRSAE